MTRTVFRFVDYTTKPDPTGEQTWRAKCVSGDVKDCDAQSPELGGDEAANDWMAEHTATTGHGRFERVYKDYAIVERRS